MKQLLAAARLVKKIAAEQGGALGQSSTRKLSLTALCIDEATATPVRAYGFDVTVSANETIEGMIDALVRRIKNSWDLGVIYREEYDNERSIISN